ncbi:MAG TPA: gliding motility-associated C-terminal domain-containing protein [Ohtaekwangia sp.]|uniref:T9SS type B sorting domain-containing protein n=1 Tax=Ohtaekwangia sp. TaxID=2066019 RepID=UPI002F932753
MKSIFTLLAAVIIAVPGFCQCINGFEKLYPDVSVDYSLNYGKSVSMYGDYLAVGVPNSDTLGRESGIVYIYKKTNNIWIKVASMVASQPAANLHLGISVTISENYLLASAEANGGQVLLYKKTAVGWVSGTEFTTLFMPGTTSFGTAYHHPVDIADDENTIVVADAMKAHNFNPTSIAGSLFIYHKSAMASWGNTLTPVEIKATYNVVDFGRAGVYISGDRIITGTPFTGSSHGNLFIYHDPSGNFNNFTLEALLSPPPDYSFWMDNFALLEDGIMWSASGNGQLQLMFFEKPTGGNWVDAIPSCIIDPDGQTNYSNLGSIRLTTNGKDLYTISRSGLGVYLSLLKKGFDWCTPSWKTLDIRHASEYGSVITGNEQGDVVTGYVPNPDNPGVSNALTVYTKAASETWAISTLYTKPLSTRNHNYGTAMALKDDFLFVSALRDNTLKSEAGKVYIYKKHGTQWSEVSAVVPNSTTYPNVHFGSALAVSKNFLVVGAQNWGSVGRFFIYQNYSGNWSNPKLFQEISIPDPQNTIISYGDNVAMNDRWLLIPYGDYSSSLDTKVAIYEYDGSTWVYRQSVSTGYFNFFSRYTTVGVAIDGNTFIARTRIFELDTNNSWVNTAQLSTTDPESLQFSSSFQVIQNGSYIGQTVAIKNNTIFIGAPGKDYNGTWDVGAVYIYTKPGSSWLDRTETLKIVPEAKQKSGLFGAALFATETSVIVGAPVAEYFSDPNLNANNPANLAGKAMLFEANDEQWSSAYLSKTYTGKGSMRDNFGIQVAMDNRQIFIASSLEDGPTGTKSGTVYITDVPLAINPAPALCNEANSTILLTAKPAGGTWTGNGILDASQGLFDPFLAGVGTHQVTYTPPAGCLSSGKINIKVNAKPPATLTVNQEYTVCKNAEIFIPLNVKSVSKCNYQWLFRENGSQSFDYLSENSITMNATLRGEYMVRVYNETCETLSDTITISDESINLIVNPIGSVCGNPPTGLALNASPTGGIWSGLGVTNNSFFMDNLSDGNYTLTYKYTSARGCNYQNQTTVKVERLVPPDIKRSGNLCEQGSVRLELTTEALSGATYTWSRKNDNDNNYVKEAIGASFETSLLGSYIVSLNKDFCTVSSSPIDISDNFSMLLTPSDAKSEVCYENDFYFSLPAYPTATYQWVYSNEGGQTETLAEFRNNIHPTKTGHYFAIITKGVCSFTSPSRYIYIHGKDSVFVPNVFTPNGDGKNDNFQIIVLNRDDDPADNDNEDKASYAIFNRYGEEVYSAPSNQPWNGSEVSTGIYYWSGVYHTCKGIQRAIKGWVHVVKE